MNEWVLDIGDIIFDQIEEYVREDIGKKYKNLFFTSTDLNDDEPSFPAVCIKEMPSTELGMTLDNDGINGVLYGLQIEIFTNKSQDEAKRVAKSVLNALKEMQFTINEMPSFDNTNLYRLIFRARRVIGANDSI